MVFVWNTGILILFTSILQTAVHESNPLEETLASHTTCKFQIDDALLVANHSNEFTVEIIVLLTRLSRETAPPSSHASYQYHGSKMSFFSS